MATLISACNSNGRIRRCDSRCYKAKGSRCTCICSGINHGTGEKQASINTQDRKMEIIESFTNEHSQFIYSAFQLNLI